MRLLCDIDGVCADYVGGLIQAIDDICGKKIQRESLTTWDFFESLPLTDIDKAFLREEINAPGFCQSLKVLPGAKEGITAIKKLGIEVLFVTAPYVTSPSWCHERSNWLISNGFAANHNEIIHTAAKHAISGDVLVDDNPDNVRAWETHNPNGTGIIFRAPYNVFAEGMKVGSFYELEAYLKWRTACPKSQPPEA